MCLKMVAQQNNGHFCLSLNVLTHWGRVTHICVNKLTIIGSDNGLSPGRRQAIIWTNAGILLIGPLETNFSEILIRIQAFSFKKMHLKMSSGKWRPSCLGLNVLTCCGPVTDHSSAFRGVFKLFFKDWWPVFNLLRAKLFRSNINIYLHFMSLLHIDMIQVLNILP